ncbi:hypothetical protein KIPB_003620 [Kipferlia bialata]|uniref:Generative cell specific-1/HAP2 domain-containing protein n=1 Tax=Kipferlia bialata TaxID=797122 RepID=A0A9K3CSK0_9EUKA|nr:hypothetical protein KIPB_003620 [Kipferlia bialata]|eukprot:g3620.t1
MRQLSHRLLTILCLCLWVCTAAASLLASSALEQCVESDAVECTTKMTIMLSLNQDTTTATIEGQVGSSSEEDGTEASPTSTVSVSCSKTASSFTYPLVYAATVNSNASETVLILGSDLNTCMADPTSTTATCPVAYDGDGELILYSQGFCCSCPVGGGVETTREEVGCTEPGRGESSAHCLTYTDLWYGAFDIGQAQLTYEVECTVTVGDQTESFSVSPSVPVAVTELGMVSGELVGDFTSPTGSLSPEGRVMLVPLTGSDDEVDAETAGIDDWLVIPETLLSRDSTEVNKVGVGYYAFWAQADKCEAQAGTGLANQPKYLRDVDASRESEGLSPLYGLEAYGTPVDTGGTSLGLAAEGLQPSTLVLSIVADSVRFVYSESPCQIDGVTVSDFDATISSGTMAAMVSNVGTASTTVMLTVECPLSDIMPVSPESATLAGAESLVMAVRITSTAPFPSEVSCSVTLRSAVTFALIDQRDVTFQPLQGDVDPGVSLVVGDTDYRWIPGSAACVSTCGYSDLWCLYTTQCYATAMVVGGVVLVALIVVGCVMARIKAVCAPVMCLFRCCCRPRRDGGRRGRRDRDRDMARFAEALTTSLSTVNGVPVTNDMMRRARAGLTRGPGRGDGIDVGDGDGLEEAGDALATDRERELERYRVDVEREMDRRERERVERFGDEESDGWEGMTGGCVASPHLRGNSSDSSYASPSMTASPSMSPSVSPSPDSDHTPAHKGAMGRRRSPQSVYPLDPHRPESQANRPGWMVPTDHAVSVRYMRISDEATIHRYFPGLQLPVTSVGVAVRGYLRQMPYGLLFEPSPGAWVLPTGAGPARVALHPDCTSRIGRQDAARVLKHFDRSAGLSFVVNPPDGEGPGETP